MDNPTFINYLRVGYVAAQILSACIYLYITQVVRHYR